MGYCYSKNTKSTDSHRRQKSKTSTVRKHFTVPLSHTLSRSFCRPSHRTVSEQHRNSDLRPISGHDIVPQGLLRMQCQAIHSGLARL